MSFDQTEAVDALAGVAEALANGVPGIGPSLFSNFAGGQVSTALRDLGGAMGGELGEAIAAAAGPLGTACGQVFGAAFDTLLHGGGAADVARERSLLEAQRTLVGTGSVANDPDRKSR